MTQSLPRVAITMGDPSGIGPEIVAMALAERKVYENCLPIVIADKKIMEQALAITRVPLVIKTISEPSEAMGKFGSIDLIDLDNVDMKGFKFGTVLPSSGKAAFESIDRAIDLAMAGAVDAVATPPINKDSINQAGFHYSGHTEIFAKKTRTERYAMMLIGDTLRVAHVSTHVSLRKACDLVKCDRVLEVIRLTAEALEDMGFLRPRIAVAGLNPHAGENGMFGDEEKCEIAPAVAMAIAEGLNVDGPLPPDSVFSRAVSGQYDAVVAMYHDQGHIPMKLRGFKFGKESGRGESISGINTTLGLPIIRSSVDHGTAFSEAGKGTANPQSMVEAILFGALMARNRR